ncbi:4Fe-4S dicluster domain-containing protein [Chloroflexota bacterium]
MHWVMAIDLKLCNGCNTCVIACKQGNGTPPGIFWAKVLEEEVGVFPLARRVFWPMRCMQCEDAVCLEVCPTGAGYQREDGLVLIDAEKCIGCKACILACPYEARYLWEGKGSYYKDSVTPYEKQAYARHVPGAVQKCDFCASRLDEGLQPHCVENCLTGALSFGDIDDPNSYVNRVLGEPRVHLQLKKELNTNPSIYYLTY